MMARTNGSCHTNVDSPLCEDAVASAWLQTPNAHLVHQGRSDYPPLLSHVNAAADTLYVKGNKSLLTQPMVAIVGSRNASRQGCRDAMIMAETLSKAGFTIVSGLAQGIDTAAHHGALRGSGSTVAIMGTGIDRIYPARNHSLAQEIFRNGALVSEFQLGLGPQRWHFPKRNRTIAGCCMGCVVIEASLESGSLITAQWALEFGREVFALPGSIHSPLSRGPHRLIREGALLVESAQEILTVLSNQQAFPCPEKTPDATHCPPIQFPANTFPSEPKDSPCARDEELLILEILSAGPLSIDQISTLSGLTAAQVSIMLTSLELRDAVGIVPGGAFQRLVS